jgi:hypothetical protein
MARGHGQMQGGICPRCRTRSLRDSRFCNQCGARLEIQYTEAFGSTQSATGSRGVPPQPAPPPGALARVEHRPPSSTASYPLPAPKRRRRRVDPARLAGPLVAAVLCFGIGVSASGIARQFMPSGAPDSADAVERAAAPIATATAEPIDVEGALIAGANRGIDLDEAGLRPGDVVTRLDGRPMRDLAEVIATVEAAPKGEPLRVEYLRDGRRQRTVIVPGDLESGGERVAPE